MNIERLNYKAEKITGTKKFKVDNKYICYVASGHNSLMHSVWLRNDNITNTNIGLKILLECQKEY